MNKPSLILLSIVLLSACGGSKDLQPDTPEQKAPAAPANLVLHSATETTLTFQWDAVAGATYLWQLTQGGAVVEEGKVSTRNVSVKNLTKATAYRFGVQASNSAGASAFTWIDATTAGTVDPEPGPTPTKAYEEFAIPAAEEDGLARAFPGAEGGGMWTTGGRGGKVYHVTNLNDSGEGSLRYGIKGYKENGKLVRPLTIVFDVAGIIELQSPLKIEKNDNDANKDEGNITIAGQTAPGDGICLKNYEFRINANNVIVRFIRCRMGDEKKTEDDAMNLYTDKNDLHDVIIDHCSLSWSTDECGTFYGMTNFTLQWCVLSESLLNSVHGKGKHGYGGIWGGTNATYHHNLLAHHYSRNPRLDHDYVSTLKGPVSLLNNVIYNWGDNSTYGGESKPGSEFKMYNIINNYYKPGPATPSGKGRFLDPTTNCKNCDSAHPDQVVPGHFYMTGNVMQNNEDYTADNWSGKATTASASLIANIKANSPFTYADQASWLSLESADNAFYSVLSYAGASLKRDSIDERVTKETREGTFTYKGSNGGDKGLIDTQNDVGGWPEYKGSTVSEFPDWVGDPNDYTLDPQKRYTNLEMYLHYLVKDIVKGGNKYGKYTKL